MDIQVLVTFATRYGATAEIAERIGQVLRDAGLRADVMPTDRVSDLSSYTAVVLGSGVYIGRWRKEAARFLKANESLLTQRAVWLFSSGPTGEGDPIEMSDGWRFPKALQLIADRIKPRDIAVFHGMIDVSKLTRLHRWMIDKVKAALGDFRNWESITAWASEVAKVLKGDGEGSRAQPEA